jgi:hypothetical protein
VQQKKTPTFFDSAFRYVWYLFWIIGAGFAFADVVDYELSVFGFFASTLLGAAWGFFVCGTVGLILGPFFPHDPFGMNLSKPERVSASIGACISVALLVLYYFTAFRPQLFVRNAHSLFYLSLGAAILSDIFALLVSAFIKGYKETRRPRRGL